MRGKQSGQPLPGHCLHLHLYTDPYGRQYTIGADGSINSIKDLNNNTLTVTPTGITGSNGLSVPFVRDSSGRITQITDPLGNICQYAYDTNGNLSTVTFPSLITPTTYGYDTTHLLTSEKDSRGNAGSSLYYPYGKIKSVTDAAGQTTSYVYNTATNTTTMTTSNGVQIIYDGDGNRVSETASGAMTKYLVDGLDPTGYSQVAEELTNGVVSAQYTIGLSRVSQRRSATSYYACDGFGSVRAYG